MSKAVKSILAVLLSALLTVTAVDWLVQRVVRMPEREYETVDAIRDYRKADPQVLVLGSSHARAFSGLAAWYAQQPTPLRMALLPIEGGKLFAYDWLLSHRLQPLVDETDGDGKRLRPSLRHLILVTNYWDLCGGADSYPNLPARAWALSDYLGDFLQHGVTAYNSNYVDQKWNEWLHGSALARDRGVGRIVPQLREWLQPRSAEDIAKTQDDKLQGWVEMIQNTDSARPDCEMAEQDAALDRMIDFAQSRGIKVSIVLWPSIPKAQVPSTIAVTERFRLHVERRVQGRDVQLVDLRTARVFADEDYRPDLDHLYPSGREKLRVWALNGPFRELAASVAGARP